MRSLETTLNTRDLGGKPTKNGLITIYNRIYRNDYDINLPLNQHDINLLISNKINNIIDKRTKEGIKNSNNYIGSLHNFKYFNYPIKEGSQIPKTVKEVPKSYMEIACSQNIKNILETIANSENGIISLFCL